MNPKKVVRIELDNGSTWYDYDYYRVSSIKIIKELNINE